MAVTADGSRVCDANRVALQAIDGSYVVQLGDRHRPLIYACGFVVSVANIAAGPSSDWRWRRVGGAFAAITATSEVSFGANTVLVDLAGLAAANKRTTQSAPAVDAHREFEGTSSNGNSAAGVSIGESTETQIALSFVNAIPGITYELEYRVTVDTTPLSVPCAALIIMAETPKSYFLPPVPQDQFY